MRVMIFSTKPYDRRSFAARNEASGHRLHYREPRLSEETASLAAGFPAVCVFVNDVCDATVLETLAAGGTRLIALRCAGFNNVDLAAAAALGISVVRVPAYSPHAVAEFTVGMILTLNRQIHRAYNRTRENNFALDGLLGFDLHGKTVGVIGTGKIGALVARTLRVGFGCEVLAFDLAPVAELEAIGIRYVDTGELVARSDIITLHCPLTPDTHHVVNARSIAAARGWKAVVAPPTCGVMSTSGADHRGWPSGRGSGSVTSRAKARRPACRRMASVSATPPRETLTRRAPDGIRDRKASSTRCAVEGESGTATKTTSASVRRSGSASIPWTVSTRSSPCRGRLATAVTFAPKTSARRAMPAPTPP